MVESITREAAVAHTVASLGLAGADLTSSEVLCGLLRRAASFLAPTTAVELRRTVSRVLAPLLVESASIDEQLEELVDVLVSVGDLVVAPARADEASRSLLYLGPPSFVLRRSGSFLLIGIRGDGAPLVDAEAELEVTLSGHLQFVAGSQESVETLEDYGLRRVPENHWMSVPQTMSAERLVQQYTDLLVRQGPAGDLVGIRVLDPDTPVTYYKGRWRAPAASDTGGFVARRDQAFGADLWCYALLESGVVVRLLDLPIEEPLWSGFDEASRLQAAVDATRGHPQVVRVSALDSSTSVVQLFSPIPRWMQRRWDLIGTASSSTGALITYCLPSSEVEEELSFAERMMWLSVERTA